MFTTSIGLLGQLRVPGTNPSWVRFVEVYTPLLHRWAIRLPGLQEEDVSDLLQDVFLALLAKLPSFQYDPKRSFRGWLWTLLLNRWRDRKPAGGALGLMSEPCQEDLASPDHAEEVEEAEFRQFLVGRALQLMQSDFEPTTWQACWECVALERPAAEVAGRLGISVAAVYIAKSRVLRRLRKELTQLLS